MHRTSIDDRRTLAELQLSKLRRLVAEILSRNRFYSSKLSSIGLESADAIQSLDDLASLPFTTKNELVEDQAGTPPYGTNLTYPLENYIRIHQTSGTSGTPLSWLDTAETWSWVVSCWDVILEAAGVEDGDRALVPFSYAPFIGFWGAFEGMLRRGLFCIAGGGMSSAARVKWIRDHGVTMLACTPTYALRLAEVGRQEGFDPPQSSVRLVIVAGEPGGSIPEVRARVERAWGARCVDHWGMTEVGPLGFEPLERPGGVHLLETDCISELVDPESGERIDGEGRGELVITTLERPGSPLIRYRTGDLVDCSVDEAGSRSRGHASGADLRTGFPFLRLEGGILGRCDQMVVVRGTNVYPGAVDAVLRSFDDVVEYRAEILEGGTGNRLRLQVELRSGDIDREGLTRALERQVKERLYFTPQIVIAPGGTLPRFEFKARRFVRVPVEESGDDA